ncbi:MAG: methyltransferase domain-containing protein [Theionarchaea archaeon]|nr:methyltransferase domain-containing protein [Theionarchaea archaeon]MBU7019546.1 methyltransferase domain-containing protein [Theionarchaea archaeon]MBU7035688.1 methyltransferase domain-containing protein [Theionarchaea archaeon]
MGNRQQGIARVARSRKEARTTYDKMSRYYDFLAGSSELKYERIGLQNLNIQKGENVLEIGFGTGQCLPALAQLVGDSGTVYGIDISTGMLNSALGRMRKAGVLNRVKLVTGDGFNLPFKAHVFDVVFMSFTLELFDTPEIPVVLSECGRVLRKGGRIGVVAMSKKGSPSVMVNLYEWAHKMLPRYVDCRPIYVQEALRDANFSVVEGMVLSMWGLPVEIRVAQT